MNKIDATPGIAALLGQTPKNRLAFIERILIQLHHGIDSD
jgi:hypothetical protein